MKNKTKGELLNIIDKMDDNNIQKDADKALMTDPIYELKATLCEFFKGRLKKVEEQEIFKEMVQKALVKKIDVEEISTAQLIGLFKIIFNESTLATESLLSVFKPSQAGAISPLLDNKLHLFN